MFIAQIIASEVLLPTVFMNNTEELQVIILKFYQISFHSWDSYISCISWLNKPAISYYISNYWRSSYVSEFANVIFLKLNAGMVILFSWLQPGQLNFAWTVLINLSIWWKYLVTHSLHKLRSWIDLLHEAVWDSLPVEVVNVVKR